jgi:hypothetical protein
LEEDTSDAGAALVPERELRKHNTCSSKHSIILVIDSIICSIIDSILVLIKYLPERHLRKHNTCSSKHTPGRDEEL